jgi:uncharacterized damage-inducible protein DinB
VIFIKKYFSLDKIILENLDGWKNVTLIKIVTIIETKKADFSRLPFNCGCNRIFRHDFFQSRRKNKFEETFSMSINDALIQELQRESKTTRKMFERLPDDAFDWKPHDKSMTLGRLAAHVAEMLLWIPATIKHDELDFSKYEYTPPPVGNRAELVEYFDSKLAEALDVLSAAKEESWMQPWTLRNGEEVYFTLPKIGVMRGMVFNHIIHHRGQLSVYMRLRDVPLPAMYGPSADEKAF